VKFKAYSIFDEKAKAFLPPFFLHNEAVAVRAFADCVNNPEHQFGKHPTDYTLFCLGGFDDTTGSFEDLGCTLVVAGVQIKGVA